MLSSAVHDCLMLLVVIATIGTTTSTIYGLMAAFAALRFRSRCSLDTAAFSPPVSVLKPLHGAEPGLEENLISFFEQDYSEFEILFCARHSTDEGLAVARKVSARYPQIHTTIVTCGEPGWPNARTYSLEKMWNLARYEILVTADSDVRVGRDYLATIVRPFHDKNVGLVTCVYRGVSPRGFWAELEAMGMSIEMTSGVLVAEMLEGMQFALGPTMVLHKSAIEKIGGLIAVAQYYADDFILGNWAAKNGYRVLLSPYVIEHHIWNLSFARSVKHQLGWATSTRFSRPYGHAGTVLTFGVPFGLLGLAASAGVHRIAWGVALLLISVMGKALLCWLVSTVVVSDRVSARKAWLYPLRDLMGFLFWAASYLRNRVSYRGEIYELLREGKLRKVA